MKDGYKQALDFSPSLYIAFGQTNLILFDHSNRKTCTDTCNIKRVGRPE